MSFRFFKSHETVGLQIPYWLTGFKGDGEGGIVSKPSGLWLMDIFYLKNLADIMEKHTLFPFPHRKAKNRRLPDQ